MHPKKSESTILMLLNNSEKPPIEKHDGKPINVLNIQASINQGCANNGPRASCSPPPTFYWAASNSENIALYSARMHISIFLILKKLLIMIYQKQS